MRVFTNTLHTTAQSQFCCVYAEKNAQAAKTTKVGQTDKKTVFRL